MKRRFITIIAAALAVATMTITACSMLSDSSEDDAPKVRSIAFDKNALNMQVGDMDIINVKIDSTKGQNKESVSWEYDENFVRVKTDNYSIVITALVPGSTVVKAVCRDYTASCAINITPATSELRVENPYVYISEDYVEVTPGETKKVFASLYGGSNADINGFTFSCDKPAVASIYTEGNYCWITGKTIGLAKVTATHTNASFSYSFLVCCADDGTVFPYITTLQNIITINKSTEGSKMLSVDMKNSINPTYKDDFEYALVDENGRQVSDPPCSIQKSGESGDMCKITPIQSGSCYVRVTHPDAAYALDVLVRIVENIDTARIEPSSPYVIVNGSNPETVTMTIFNGDSAIEADPDKFEWEPSESASAFVDYNIFGGSEQGKGDSISISGKRSGSVKFTVSHPLCETKRSFVVVVRNVAGEASNSQTYITTSQNFVSTYVGAEDTTVYITIENLHETEIERLLWKIENTAADGSPDPVVVWQAGNGTSVSSSVFKSMLFASAKAVIKPVKEGSAKITISHPLAAYPTSILVSVKGQPPVKEAKASVSLNASIATIKNGETAEITARLSSGFNENEIVWSVEGSGFEITPAGATVAVTANGTGVNSATLVASHPKADVPAKASLCSYDDQEQLSEIKALQAVQMSHTVYTGESTTLRLSSIGIDASQIRWKKCGGNGAVELSGGGDAMSVTGSVPGTVEIEASCDGLSAVFYVTVKQGGIKDEDLPCYLTTEHNVVTLQAGETYDASVKAVNILPSEFKNIAWSVSPPNVATVSSNGESATISATAPGTASITVSHPLSSNTLSMMVHVGDPVVYNNTDQAYISCDGTARLVAGSDPVFFQAVLAHTETPETSTDSFTFRSSDPTVFDVEPAPQGANLKPKKAGHAMLTVSHREAEFAKEVVVVVEKSAAELSNVAYITTNQNVATVVQGDYAVLTASLLNAQAGNNSDWKWSSTDFSIADVAMNSGSTAMIAGISPGTTKIKVSHKDAPVPIEIIVICLDKTVAAAKPFIQTSTNILNLDLSHSQTATAKMIEGSTADDSQFVWTCQDTSVAMVTPAGASCTVKGLRKGQTYITVRNRNHPDAYAKTILVRVEDTIDEQCYITVDTSVVSLKPDDRNGMTITAKLENGDVLDAKDFVWWADDYNIVNITATAETALVTPTGRAGTTYIHLKHPKVLNPLEILVLCSQYTEFAFAQKSIKIMQNQIAFVNMQIPAIDGKHTIEYWSEDTEICIATGSDSVCMVGASPIRKGSAVVFAALKGAGGEIARAQLSVIVEEAPPNTNTISVTNSVITLLPGESTTIEAKLNGKSFNTNDYYAIKWTTSDPGIASLLATEDNVTSGKSVYLKGNKSGYAIVTATHKDCAYPLQICVYVPEMKEPDLVLDQSNIMMYKSDGSVTITATVINGNKGDENTIMWTATKSGGSNIVSITKAKGKTCTIVPRDEGFAQVRAQLPNGKFKDCIVKVLGNASITLEAARVRVNPGDEYAVPIKYTVKPQNAMIQWICTSNSTAGLGQEQQTPFEAHEVMTTEPGERILLVTGHSLGSGKVYGYSASANGTSSATLEVIVEYNSDLKFVSPGQEQLLPTKGKDERDIKFVVTPPSLPVEAKITDSYNPARLQIVKLTQDKTTGEGVVTVKAKGETVGATLTITTVSPDKKTLKKTKALTSYYPDLDITPVFETESSNFTKVTTQNSGNHKNYTINLGDGEQIRFAFKVEQENADVSSIEVSLGEFINGQPLNQPLMRNHIISTSEGGHLSLTQDSQPTSSELSNSWTLKHDTDVRSKGNYVYVKGLFGNAGNIRPGQGWNWYHDENNGTNNSRSSEYEYDHWYDGMKKIGAMQCIRELCYGVQSEGQRRTGENTYEPITIRKRSKYVYYTYDIAGEKYCKIGGYDLGCWNVTHLERIWVCTNDVKEKYAYFEIWNPDELETKIGRNDEGVIVEWDLKPDADGNFRCYMEWPYDSDADQWTRYITTPEEPVEPGAAFLDTWYKLINTAGYVTDQYRHDHGVARSVNQIYAIRKDVFLQNYFYRGRVDLDARGGQVTYKKKGETSVPTKIPLDPNDKKSWMKQGILQMAGADDDNWGLIASIKSNTDKRTNKPEESLKKMLDAANMGLGNINNATLICLYPPDMILWDSVEKGYDDPADTYETSEYSPHNYSRRLNVTITRGAFKNSLSSSETRPEGLPPEKKTFSIKLIVTVRNAAAGTNGTWGSQRGDEIWYAKHNNFKTETD